MAQYFNFKFAWSIMQYSTAPYKTLKRNWWNNNKSNDVKSSTLKRAQNLECSRSTENLTVHKGETQY